MLHTKDKPSIGFVKLRSLAPTVPSTPPPLPTPPSHTNKPRTGHGSPSGGRGQASAQPLMMEREAQCNFVWRESGRCPLAKSTFISLIVNSHSESYLAGLAHGRYGYCRKITGCLTFAALWGPTSSRLMRSPTVRVECLFTVQAPVFTLSPARASRLLERPPGPGSGLSQLQ